MASLSSKLARLRPLSDANPSVSAEPAPDQEPFGRGPSAAEHLNADSEVARRGRSEKPTLDELRTRIAAILRTAPSEPGRKESAQGSSRRSIEPLSEFDDLPFVEEETALGPLHLARKKAGTAARVGTAPLSRATLAEPAMLALLALDPALAGCDPKRALYLDTETTGLSGGTGTVAFLVGLSFFDERENTFVLEQVLLRKLGEEGPLLQHVARRLDDASMLVTFNGKSFDWPLLRARAVMNRMPPFRELPHLDLVHVARRIHRAAPSLPLRGLTSCTLKSVEEEVLGLVRIDDVAGQDIASHYLHYLRTRDASALSGVVEHNATDVLSMVALVGFYGEPLTSLGAADLARAAKTIQRAGNLARAEAIADEVASRVAEQACPSTFAGAMRVRGDIYKAQGDKSRALSDYQRAFDASPDPGVTLELAKLYEHFSRAFDKALATISSGTAEAPAAHEKRRARLARRLTVSRATVDADDERRASCVPRASTKRR